MSIKAIFPAGVTALTVNGLHQWDYGRNLEIHSENLSAQIEVHFSCPGMKEAFVRTAATINGVATVAIPDVCLEQSSPILAWVYEINGTAGVTTKTIQLNVIERARPKASEDIPQEISDKYTEAVTTFNEQVESLKNGNTKVRLAAHADAATFADSAALATNADKATKAETASFAYRAESANSADFANNAAFAAAALFVSPINIASEYNIQAVEEAGVYIIGIAYGVEASEHITLMIRVGDLSIAAVSPQAFYGGNAGTYVAIEYVPAAPEGAGSFFKIVTNDKENYDSFVFDYVVKIA